MNDNQQFRHELTRYNQQLKTSFSRLRDYADDPEVAAARQDLRALGKQIQAASDLLNQGKLDAAQAAAPTRLQVKEACRQADQIVTFEDNLSEQPDQSGDSEQTDQGPSSPLAEAENQSDDTDGSPEQSAEEPDEQPTEDTSSGNDSGSRHAPAQEPHKEPPTKNGGYPDLLTELRAKMYARGVTVDDLVSAGSKAGWLDDRRPRGRRHGRTNNQDR